MVTIKHEIGTPTKQRAPSPAPDIKQEPGTSSKRKHNAPEQEWRAKFVGQGKRPKRQKQSDLPNDAAMVEADDHGDDVVGAFPTPVTPREITESSSCGIATPPEEDDDNEREAAVEATQLQSPDQGVQEDNRSVRDFETPAELLRILGSNHGLGTKLVHVAIEETIDHALAGPPVGDPATLGWDYLDVFVAALRGEGTRDSRVEDIDHLLRDAWRLRLMKTVGSKTISADCMRSALDAYTSTLPFRPGHNGYDLQLPAPGVQVRAFAPDSGTVDPMSGTPAARSELLCAPAHREGHNMPPTEDEGIGRVMESCGAQSIKQEHGHARVEELAAASASRPTTRQSRPPPSYQQPHQKQTDADNHTEFKRRCQGPFRTFYITLARHCEIYFYGLDGAAAVESGLFDHAEVLFESLAAQEQNAWRSVYHMTYEIRQQLMETQKIPARFDEVLWGSNHGKSTPSHDEQAVVQRGAQEHIGTPITTAPTTNLHVANHSRPSTSPRKLSVPTGPAKMVWGAVGSVRKRAVVEDGDDSARIYFACKPGRDCTRRVAFVLSSPDMQQVKLTTARLHSACATAFAVEEGNGGFRGVEQWSDYIWTAYFSSHWQAQRAKGKAVQLNGIYLAPEHAWSKAPSIFHSDFTGVDVSDDQIAIQVARAFADSPGKPKLFVQRSTKLYAGRQVFIRPPHPLQLICFYVKLHTMDPDVAHVACFKPLAPAASCPICRATHEARICAHAEPMTLPSLA